MQDTKQGPTLPTLGDGSPITPPEWIEEFDGYHRLLARGLLLIVHPCHRWRSVYRWRVTRAGALVGPSMMHPDADGLSLDVAKARAIAYAMSIADDDALFWESIQSAPAEAPLAERAVSS